MTKIKKPIKWGEAITEYDHETLEVLKKKEQNKKVKPVSLWTLK